MAKKQPARAAGEGRSITSERAVRLHQLIRLLGAGPQTRRVLTKKLRVDVRGFYRDLELLREAGIAIPLVDQQYGLGDKLATVLEKLPFPDPHLTLGEARTLARGRTAAHRKLRGQIAQIVD
jgi:hypothetical protein